MLFHNIVILISTFLHLFCIIYCFQNLITLVDCKKRRCRTKSQRRNSFVKKRMKGAASGDAPNVNNHEPVEVSGLCLLPRESELRAIGYSHGGCLARALHLLGVHHDLNIIIKELNGAGEEVLGKFRDINGDNYPADYVYQHNDYWHPEVTNCALNKLGFYCNRLNLNKVILNDKLTKKGGLFLIDGILNQKFKHGKVWIEMDPDDTTHPDKCPPKWRHCIACKGRGKTALCMDKNVNDDFTFSNKWLYLNKKSNGLNMNKGYMRKILIVYEISRSK